MFSFQTESDLYLLVTFHNLSAPFTVDCEGAYIEVERENNGFEARWCGNRVTQVNKVELLLRSLFKQYKENDYIYLGYVAINITLERSLNIAIRYT